LDINQSASNKNKFRWQCGLERIDTFVERFLINSAIGKDIVNYEYIPSNGLLCDTYKCAKANTYREFRASLKHFRARMDYTCQ